MDTLASRLAQAMGEMKPPELAKRVGVTKQTIYNLLDTATKADTVRASTLLQVAAVLTVHPEWLLYGRGSSGQASQTARPDPATLAATQDFCERAFAVSGKAFSLRTDADLFADAYEYLSEDDRPIEQKNLVHFAEWLATRRREDEEQSGSVTGKVAAKNRSRAARTA